MSKIVLIPINLDALYLKYGTSVAQAKIDFSHLPFFDGNRDWYADTVNLSESISSQPFQNKNLYLKPGIHLHWALPDTLTRGKHTEAGRTFPIVPNRWLVIRKGKEVIEKKWLIESDYLYPPETKYEETEDSVTYPIHYPYNDKQSEQNAPPFCYLGRKILFEQWKDKPRASSNDTNDKYLQELTAIGYGESTFAAFYPNCLSVFGFHDHDYAGEQPIPEGLQYDLIGWYEKPGQDYLREFINQFVKNHQKLPTAAEIKRELQWEEIELNDDHDVSLICYARIEFQPAKNASLSLQSGANVELAVGNTGIEALLAYLAEKIAKENKEIKKAIAEEQLAAIYFADTLESRQLDVGAKFQELRHEASFNGVSAGILWEIRSETNSSENSEQSQSSQPLPAEITHLLYQVNQKQQQYNCAQEDIVSMQRQLFSDWYKYMVSTYPPEASWDNYPDIDEVKSYIEQQGIKPLEKKISETGELTWKVEQGKIISAAAHRRVLSKDEPQGKTEFVAHKLATAINELIAKIKAYNESIAKDPNRKLQKTYKLEQVAAPRHWQPKEPVVLLVGDDLLKATKRHGQDGILKCYVLSNITIQSLIQDNFSLVIAKLDEIFKGPASKNCIGFTTWRSQPWNPILLEWLAEIFPIKNSKGTPSGRYANNFIVNQYILKEQAVDLSDKKEYQSQDQNKERKSILTTKDFNIYSGSTILTSYSGKLLDEKIKQYLSKNLTLPQLDFNNFEKILNYFGNGISPEKLPKTIEHPIIKAIADYEKILESQKTDKKGEAYLRQNISRDYPEYPQVVKIDDSKYLSQVENIRKIKKWYEQAIKNEDKKLELIIPNLLYTATLAYKELQNFNCLSQSLGGFNEALLMQKQTMQLAIEEPLAFDAYRQFTERVQKLVDNQNCVAPQPLNDFRPVRTGELQIISLQLVDTFGQVRQLNWEQRNSDNNEQKEVVIVPETMKTTSAKNRIVMPPRLVQPAQINFHWLTANEDIPQNADASKTVPDTDQSPICGWIILNNVNDSLVFFDNKGKSLGTLEKNKDDIVWNPAPSENPINTIELIPNFHLRVFIKEIEKLSLQKEEKSFFTEFRQVIANALENIEPENIVQPPPQVLFIGRPLAVVRAEISLELQGIPAINQNWQVFRQDMQLDKSIEQRETNDFTEVEFPIRIGEFQHLNDGLIGYWLETKATKDPETYQYEKDLFYAIQSDATESKHIETQFWDTSNNPQGVEEGPINIIQSIKKPPQKLTMLIDPRGEIHATCGILPTKAIRIPPEQYIPALEAIEVAFLTTPVLMEHKKYPLPLMTVPEYDWSWLEKHGNAWHKVYSQATINQQDFLDDWPNELLKWLGENPQEVAICLESEKNKGSAAWQAFIKEKGFQSSLNEPDFINGLLDDWLKWLQNNSQEAAKYLEAEKGKALEYWQVLIEQKWLQPLEESNRKIAYITLPIAAQETEQQKNNKMLLQGKLVGKDTPVKRVLERCQSSITPAISEANFSSNQEIREGWLIISRSQQKLLESKES